MPRKPVWILVAVAAALTGPAVALAAGPSNTAPPSIGGVAREGQALTRDTGTWSGTGTITYAQRWQRCDAAGAECVNLPATAVSYTAVAADVGSTLRVVVTATNAEGVATATSEPTAVVTGTPPANTAAPAVSGNLRVGQSLTATKGTWTGTSPITHAYQWRRCDGAGSACETLDGETAATYRLQAADLGRTIRARVIATNPAGTGEATSAATAAVGPADPPASAAVPVVSGTPRDGSTLSVTTGTWSGAAPISYARRWQRCDALGQGCLDTPGTSATYLAGPSDIGGTLRVVVTATNPDGTATATSDATAVVATNPPSNTAAPAVSGAPRVGQTLTASNGTFTGTQPLAYVREWRRCDPSGASCVAIPGADGSAYTVGNEDLDRTIRHVVTASNEGGTATGTSNATQLVGPAQPPVGTALPTVTGTSADGQTLSSSTGTWTGAGPITYARRWQRCDAEGAACEDLGVTAPVYKQQSADVGSRLRVVVTATNPDGTASAASEPAAVTAAVAPRQSAVPAITGTAKDQHTLTTTTGTWTGTTPMDLSVRWLRCDGGGANCAPVPGATSTTLTLTPQDIGTTMRTEVTATNAGGTATSTSNASALVTASPPAVTVSPAVTGTARDGERLTAASGTWTGTAPIAFAYQWRRCSALGSGCKDLTGATSATYDLSPADVGQTLSVRVTASNTAGSAPATSPLTAAVAADPPRSTSPPAVTGEAVDGATLAASPGTWTGTPAIALTYRWERCDELSGCRTIPGATAQTLALTSADVGFEVRVAVTGTNTGGAATATSAPTVPVAPVAPASTSAPRLSGTARDGEVLTVTPGTWAGTSPMDVTHQWRRCDAQGAACGDIEGATGTSYTLTPADVGATVRVEATAANGSGRASATSTQTSVVLARPPANVVTPVVTGLARDGRTLTVEPGEWSGTPSLEYRYGWRRCDTGGLRCTVIEAAASPSYVLTTADVGGTVRAVVTVTNGGGTAAVTTAQTGVVQPSPPVNQGLPRIEGEVVEGSVVTSTTGAWSGLVPITHDHRWWRCDASGENCSAIPGAESADYEVTGIEVGLTLRAEVIARNAGGATSALSEPTPVGEPAPPANTAPPGLRGHHGAGFVMEAVRGGWSGSPVLRFTYQWLRCDAAGDGCTEAAGETGDAIRFTGADVGHAFRVRVTVRNAAGSATATSDPGPVVRDDPPVNDVPPAVTGSPVAETVPLQAAPGTWSGATPMTAAHQWRRCDAAGGACEDIAGATERGYTPVAADLGRTLRVVVTMDNGVGAVPATSAPTAPVGKAPPRTVTPPGATAASLRPGRDAKGTSGEWTGAAPLAFAHQWLRCDAVGESCAVIPDATTLKYTFTSADLGATVRLRVVATNASGTATSTSAPLGPVLALPPSISGKPKVTVEGRPRAGSILRAEAGSWAGSLPITFAYRWQRCVSTSDCRDVAGAAGPEYVATDEDVGRRLRVVVTAANSAGSASAESAASDLVAGRSPSPGEKPAVTGAPEDGRKLKATPGTWDGTAPLDHAYAWLRCQGPTCKPIAGAISKTYRLGSEDVGWRIAVKVTTSNAYGKSEATSGSTEPVEAIKPLNRKRPSIVRLPTQLEPGLPLKGRDGRWTGSGPLELARQWLRCDRYGRKCRLIKGQTAATYVLKRRDVRRGRIRGAIRLAVTATNRSGEATELSNPVGARMPPPRKRLVFVAAAYAQGKLALAVSCAAGRAPCAGRIKAAGSGARFEVAGGASTLVLVKARERVGSRVVVRFLPDSDTAGRKVKAKVAVSRPAAGEAPPPE